MFAPRIRTLSCAIILMLALHLLGTVMPVDAAQDDLQPLGLASDVTNAPGLQVDVKTAVPEDTRPLFYQMEQLKADHRLDIQLNYETKRASLSNAISEIGNLGQISLAIQPELADRLLTAHFEAQPLREVMWALCRLYGLSWQAEGAGYVGHSDGNKWEREVLRLGDVDKLRRPEWGIGSKMVRQLGGQIVKQQPDLLTGKQVGILTLSEDLRRRLRTSAQDRNAVDLLTSYSRALPINILNGFLEWRVVSPRTAEASARQEVAQKRVPVILFSLRYGEQARVPLGRAQAASTPESEGN